MRAPAKPILQIFTAITLSLLLPVAAASADTITLRADEWCPYTCAPDSERPGFAVEIAREAFALSGGVVDYQMLNWERSIAETRRGLHAGIIGALVAEAPDFVFPSEPIAVEAVGFAVRKGEAFEFRGAPSLTGKVLGAISGYSYYGDVGPYVEAHASDREKVQLASGEDALEKNLKKLAAGRIDVFVDYVNVLRSAIAEQGLADRVEIADSDAAGDLFIAFSPAIPQAGQYARRLSDGIVRLRASGRLAEILKPYGIADWR